MSEYEMKLTAEVSYGKEVGKQRYTIELEDSAATAFDLLEVFKCLTLSMGYSEESWKRAVVNMADDYMAEIRELEELDELITTEPRGCPVTGYYKVDMTQYSNQTVTEENC